MEEVFELADAKLLSGKGLIVFLKYRLQLSLCKCLHRVSPQSDIRLSMYIDQGHGLLYITPKYSTHAASVRTAKFQLSLIHSVLYDKLVSRERTPEIQIYLKSLIRRST
jgi:hypothetical protein